jgi:hypothetical protein
VHHAVEYAAIQNAELSTKRSNQSTTGPESTASTSSETTKSLKKTQLPQHSLQTGHTKFDRDHPKQILITQKIAEMMCRDNQPFTIVEDAGFRALLNAAEPRYTIPSRKTFSEHIVPKLYSEIISAVKSDVHGASSLAFTTDAWSSRANQSYLSYTAHFLSQDFKTRNYCLGVENVDESHTATCLAKSLADQTVTWTSESQRKNNVKVAVVSDNAANIQAAITKVQSCLPVKCFNHTLQLTIEDVVRPCDELQNTVQKAKAITTHFKHSCQNTKKLLDREKQFGLPELKLKQECVTRWNSRYDMLERLITVKDAVTSVISCEKKLKCLSPTEWEIAEEYVKVFKPFKILTATMSSTKYPTISMVIPELNKLKHALLTDENLQATYLPTLKEDLITTIDRRWPQYEFNNVYAIATIVDPRYKDCGFSDDSVSSAARNLVHREMMILTKPAVTVQHLTDLSGAEEHVPSTSSRSSGL